MTADGGRALSGRELLKRLIFDSYPEREAAAVTDGLGRLRKPSWSLSLTGLSLSRSAGMSTDISYLGLRRLK